MREKKHCDTCNHTYMKRENSRLRQKCRSPEYNADEMLMEDWGRSHCRFWTPKTRKG